MLNIDDEDYDEETLEDKIFEKADYIGEILTGERKIDMPHPKKVPIKPKKQKPSKIKNIINSFKSSLQKYKTMSLSRIIGLGIIFLLSVFCIAIAAYLLLFLMTNLLKLGILGFAIFAIFMCTLCASIVLLIASRFTRK